MLDEQEYARRKRHYKDAGHRHYYFMSVGNGEVVDACIKVSRQHSRPCFDDQGLDQRFVQPHSTHHSCSREHVMAAVCSLLKQPASACMAHGMHSARISDAVQQRLSTESVV